MRLLYQNIFGTREGVRKEEKRNSRLLGYVNFDGQNHRFVRKRLFPDLDITFRILDII